MPGLQAVKYLPGSACSDEVAGQAGADVLDLADDPQAVLAEQVELGDLGAGVGDREPQRAGRRPRSRTRRTRRRWTSTVSAPAESPEAPASPGALAAQAASSGRTSAAGRRRSAGSGGAWVSSERGRWRGQAAVARTAGATAGAGGAGVARSRTWSEEEDTSSARRRATQAMASSQVVAGEKLKMPLSRVPYQLSAGSACETSKARLFRPGQDAGLLQVVDAVGEHAGGDDDQERAGPGEELGQVDRDRAAVDQVAEHDRGGEPERGAEQRRDGAAASPRVLAWVAAQRNSAVSRPSRPTASMATTTTTTTGRRSAASSIWRAQLAGSAARGARHPEDHPGDEADGDDRQACRRWPPAPRRSGRAGRRSAARRTPSDTATATPTPTQIRGSRCRGGRS